MCVLKIHVNFGEFNFNIREILVSFVLQIRIALHMQVMSHVHGTRAYRTTSNERHVTPNANCELLLKQDIRLLTRRVHAWTYISKSQRIKTVYNKIKAIVLF